MFSGNSAANTNGFRHIFMPRFVALRLSLSFKAVFSRRQRRENRKCSQRGRCAVLAVTCFWFSLQAVGVSASENVEPARVDQRRSVPLERHIRLPADVCHLATITNHLSSRRVLHTADSALRSRS